MTSNKTQHSIVNMSPTQFRNWLHQIMNSSLFTDQNKLTNLLTQDADRETVAEGFREFYESYSYDLAYELDEQEEYVLKVLDKSKELIHLKQRVSVVKKQRKTSHNGRIVRRLGGKPDNGQYLQKITDLSDNEFKALMEILLSSKLFAARERVVKLMKEHETPVNHGQLQSVFYEFFVCHLELEQVLEDFEYDPDEELQIHPKVAEQLDSSIADYESGKDKGRSLEEVAKEFRIDLKCTH